MKVSIVIKACVVVLAASISACGGGGGGGGGTKPSSTQPASSSTPLSSSLSSSVVALSSSAMPLSSAAASSSVPATTQLTIQGKAVADALAGGEVIFTIGEKNYKTAINDSLEYNIVLDIPNLDIDKPFVGVATGAGVDAWVKLAALYPSVNALLEKAGSDKVLTDEEFFDVNITPLTTAIYAEVNNNTESLLTDEQRQNAMLDLNSINALQGAGLLQRLLTDIDYKLPEPATTTLDFLLNANLQETYREIANSTESDWLDEALAELQENPAQFLVSGKKLSGHYFLETKNGSKYIIAFRNNGTGELTTGSLDERHYDERNEYPVTVDFTWQQNGKVITVTFNEAVKYLVVWGGLVDGFEYDCDNSSTAQIYEQCEMDFKSLEITLLTETEFNHFAKVSLFGTAINPRQSTSEEGLLATYWARLTVFDRVPPIIATDIIGYEWYTGEYRFKFNEDLTAEVTHLSTNTVTTSSWGYEENYIDLDGMGLWITNTNAAGYDIVQVVGSDVTTTSMFKRTSVVMSESDWIGRWSGFPQNLYSYAHDVNDDKTWNDGFEANIAGSWSRLDDHRQLSISNGAWRMERDVLAIHDEKYYMNVCHGEEKEIFVPLNCYISVMTKSPDFSTAMFWGTWSYPAFNERGTGEAWVPIGDRTFVNAGTPDFTVNDFFRVSSNKTFNRDTGTILEMTGATTNTIELCEYELFDACDESDKRIYEKGIQVKIAAGAFILLNYQGYGYDSFYTTELYFTNAFMLPKGRDKVIKIFSLGSNSIQTVSGCGGTFNGVQYTIPARSTDCELVVEFVSAP
ncbi:MAG TPA: hypothetical protein VL995_20570 [Cellvibrio sp.]|nr:hypothetical protein [Cellvibrio sp.]